MLAVKLSAELENTLTQLAQDTGRSKAYHVREALQNYFANLKNKKTLSPGGYDTKNPAFKEQLHRECEAIRNSEDEKEVLKFCEAAFEENIPDDWKW
ncbi:MAG: DUF3018 family protein [Rhodocyclaceae bacterium]|nr:DUF3018 family protein [Rhodocyclaceae bacterium]